MTGEEYWAIGARVAGPICRRCNAAGGGCTPTEDNRFAGKVVDGEETYDHHVSVEITHGPEREVGRTRLIRKDRLEYAD